MILAVSTNIGKVREKGVCAFDEVAESLLGVILGPSHSGRGGGFVPNKGNGLTDLPENGLVVHPTYAVPSRTTPIVAKVNTPIDSVTSTHGSPDTTGG